MWPWWLNWVEVGVEALGREVGWQGGVGGVEGVGEGVSGRGQGGIAVEEENAGVGWNGVAELALPHFKADGADLEGWGGTVLDGDRDGGGPTRVGSEDSGNG